jgi:hypothetical protein
LSTKSRLLFAAPVVSALLLSPTQAGATGAVLATSSGAEPATLDVSTAIAVTPYGTTRWTRLTVGGAQRVMWLVPARPGAALDWASPTWLDALDDATAPRVVAPSASPPCGMPSTPERVATFGSAGPVRMPTNLTILASEDAARAHAAARGFAVSSSQSTKIAQLYASGGALVALELDTPPSGTTTTPTLRVSDDGPAVVPLALTGSRNARTRVTAFVVASGASSIAGAADVEPGVLTWGAARSNYGYARSSRLASGGWQRESAARVVFDGVPVPRGEAIPSVVSGYFADAACASTARAAAQSEGAVARTCAAGTIGRVPGGPSCAPAAGAIDPTPFTCGRDADDLALALAGLSPKDVVVSRFAGVVVEGTLGADAPIAAGASLVSPVVTPGSFDECSPGPSSPPSTSGGLTEPSQESRVVSDDEPRYVTTHGACGGSTTTVVTSDEEEDTSSDDSGGCGGSSTGTSTSEGSSDGESCSGDSKKSDDDGWDSSDDDDDDDSSSKKDDSCSKSSSSSSSSSSGSSDDGWDSSDAVKTKAKPAKASPTSRLKRRRGSSPVSRMALAAVAIVLPLRRRRRTMPKL